MSFNDLLSASLYDLQKYFEGKTVNEEHVEWACKLIDEIVPDMVDDVRTYISYNSQDALRRRILKLVSVKRFVSKAVIYRDFRDCTHRQAEDVLAILMNSKQITEMTMISKNKSLEGYVKCAE